MSYTNIDLLRHHLDAAYPIEKNVYNHQVVMSGLDEITFFGGSIKNGSIKVKTVKSYLPLNKDIDLSGSNLISTSPIVPGSVVIAQNSSMAGIYTENIDYIIDYEIASITPKDGGSLSDNAKIHVWYVPFFEYKDGADYKVELSKGTIRRLAGGSIADGETIYLDYEPIFLNVTDDVLNYAVIEANNYVERTIDPYSQFGADTLLMTGATYRALEIVCRTSAMRELSSGRKNEKAATVWMNIAEKYASISVEMLRSFKEQPSEPSNPKHS